MTADKRAMDDLERSVREVVKVAEEKGAEPVTLASFEGLASMERSEEPALIFVTLGLRGELDDAHARDAAEALPKMHAKLPNATFYLVVAGFDDDPREVHEIPEVRSFFRAVARMAGIRRREDVRRAGLHEHSLAIFALCGAIEDVSPEQVRITR